MKHSNYFSTFFSIKIAKHEKYRVLLIFDDLSKKVKNNILAYDSTLFKEIDDNSIVSRELLWILCSLLYNDVILYYAV